MCLKGIQWRPKVGEGGGMIVRVATLLQLPTHIQLRQRLLSGIDAVSGSSGDASSVYHPQGVWRCLEVEEMGS